jgi:hypothetical protein
VADPTSPTGAREVARTAACDRSGLDRFVTAHNAAGHAVQTWEVLALAEVVVTAHPDGDPEPVA